MTAKQVLVHNATASFLERDEAHFEGDENLFFQKLDSCETPRVLIFDIHRLKDPIPFLNRLHSTSPSSLWLVENFENLKLELQKLIISFPQFSGKLQLNDLHQNRTIFEKSLGRLSETIQELDLLKVLNSQNSKLKNELEKLDSVPSKSSKVTKANQRIGNLRMKVLEDSLIEVLKAKSVHSLETSLQRTLAKLLPLDFTRILFNEQNSLVQNKDLPQIKKIPLQTFSGISKAWLVLGLKGSKNLTDREQELLEEISEITSLSLNRILQLEASESLKKQWDATFDAIFNPLCLVNESMEILRTNKAFSNATQKSFKSLLGENALRVFFKDNPEVWQTPPPINLKMQIQSKGDGKFYSLMIHDLGFKIDRHSMHLLLIKDITDEMKLERQIREKSKLVELGTIGSSIAHELNNPLAGMLSYLQLLLMDEPKESETYEDLKEMEQATLRCRDIVLSLLGFSRKQTAENIGLLDLNELVQKSVQLIELKSRFRKIQIEINELSSKAIIRGDQNALMQGITHLLSNSLEALEEKLALEKDFHARIQIQVSEHNENFVVEIKDNGPGISEKNLNQIINPLFSTKSSSDHAGLGLTVAYSIFSEHKGSLEIESRPGQGVSAIISLPRPENMGSSRGIDTQI